MNDLETTTESTKPDNQHIVRGRQDVCLEYFGVEDDECKRYNFYSGMPPYETVIL